MKPNILITNDDGIQSPGLRHLWECLKNFANLTVIAPVKERSGAGLGITIQEPLRIEEFLGFESTPAWCISGTPADCVKLALKVLCNYQPDLIVSGINHGSNAGRNVLYSGTIAGVIEGIMHDIPGIAFSCWDFKEPSFTSVSPYIPRLIQYALKHPMPSGTLLNVNFPPKQIDIKGIKLARQGREFWIEDPSKHHQTTTQHTYYWLGMKAAQFQEEEDSDIHLLRQGYATAVPVHVHELTDHVHLKKHKEHFEKLINFS